MIHAAFTGTSFSDSKGEKEESAEIVMLGKKVERKKRLGEETRGSEEAHMNKTFNLCGKKTRLEKEKYSRALKTTNTEKAKVSKDVGECLSSSCMHTQVILRSDFKEVGGAWLVI